MACKYYSDKTKKFYESEQACVDAEKALVEAETSKAAARKEDAEKVRQALVDFTKARNHYHEVLNDFCKKHGPYHTSLKPLTWGENSDWESKWSEILDLFIP